MLAGWLDYTARAEAGELLPMSTPGHKQRTDLVGSVVAGDAPFYGGVDTIKHADHLRVDAEARAAALWGADWCRFSVAGSTHGNQALALAVGAPGQKVIINRTLHRSLLLGLVLAGLQPVWVRPGHRPGLRAAGRRRRPDRAGRAGRAPGRVRGVPRRPDLRRHDRRPRWPGRGRARRWGAADRGRGLGRAPGLPSRSAAARDRGRRGRDGDQRAQGAARLHPGRDRAGPDGAAGSHPAGPRVRGDAHYQPDWLDPG